MNIIEEIKNAEQKAQEIKREANVKAREIVLNMELECKAESEKELELAKEKAGEIQAKAAAEADKKASEFVLACSKKDDELISKAKHKFDDAVAYIVKSAGDFK